MYIGVALTTQFMGLTGTFWGVGSITGSATLSSGLSASASIYGQYNGGFSSGYTFKETNSPTRFSSSGSISQSFVTKFDLEAEIDISLSLGESFLSVGLTLGTYLTPTLTYDSSVTSSCLGTSNTPAELSFELSAAVDLASIQVSVFSINVGSPPARMILFQNSACEPGNAPKVPTMNPIFSLMPTWATDHDDVTTASASYSCPAGQYFNGYSDVYSNDFWGGTSVSYLESCVNCPAGQHSKYTGTYFKYSNHHLKAGNL